MSEITLTKLRHTCICETCGKEFHVQQRRKECGKCRSSEFRKNNPRSKGCPPKHGLHSHPLWPIYASMKARCELKTHKAYKHYGGRGIQCHFESLPQFVDWALKAGYRKGLTIDRIDNDGPYHPENCRWVTMKEQSRNKRTNVMVEHAGENRCLAEWAEILGINERTVRSRIRRGIPHTEALGLI